MINGLIPTDFSGCKSEELGRALYSSCVLYDEVGHVNFGWFGLTYYEKMPYIISITGDKKFNYKVYSSPHAAKKAWDHICLKFEKWYTERNHE